MSGIRYAELQFHGGIKMRRIITTATVFLVILAIAAFAGDKSSDSGKKLRTYKGTWTCLACDLKKLNDDNAQCEVFGHKHALRLADGKYVNFLENDHSVELIKGGGRHQTQIEVTGYFDSNSRTLDVVKYEIDGMVTEWCPEHSRMDLCMETKKDPKTTVTEKTDN